MQCLPSLEKERRMHDNRSGEKRMVNLTNLYKWFDENRSSIIADHSNECVLLKDNAVIGYYPNTDAALFAAEKNGFVLGEFLVQDCISAEEEVMTYYNQAVCFGN